MIRLIRLKVLSLPTAIPGCEDWSVVNPQAVDIQMDNDEQ